MLVYQVVFFMFAALMCLFGISQLVYLLVRKRVKRIGMRMIGIIVLGYLFVVYANATLILTGILQDGERVLSGIYTSIGVIIMIALYIGENLSCQRHQQ